MPATLRRPAPTEPTPIEVTPEMLHTTLKELRKLPRDVQSAIVRRQAELAAADYAADLALPHAERELTAFESLNSFDPIHEDAE